MANKEQLYILKFGVTKWNEWRSLRLGEPLDLRGACLIDANLIGVDLSRANLIDADLSRANLSRADLSDSDLSRANLVHANLSGANLGGANLAGADLGAADLSDSDLSDTELSNAHLFNANLICANLKGADLYTANLMMAKLSGADFTGAKLGGANLSRAKLDHADFKGATFGLTSLGDVDLSTAKGLDSADHSHASIIGIDTFYKSGGNIPEVFLRGCGVPDAFITYSRSLIGTTIDFYSCFISYSSKNQDIADRLYSDLQSKGVRCWFAPEDLKIGDKFRQQIDESIRLHDKLLLVLSEESIASPWVEDEVEAALERERRENRLVLFPVTIDGAVWDSDKAWAASLRRMRHIGDFKQWASHDSYQKAFERLLRDLKASEPDK